jgi:hypothetical protein
MKSRDPRIRMLRRFAKAMDIPLADLIDEKKSRKPTKQKTGTVEMWFDCQACGKKHILGSCFECDKCGKVICLQCVKGTTSAGFTKCKTQPNGTPYCEGTMKRKSST